MCISASLSLASKVAYFKAAWLLSEKSTGQRMCRTFMIFPFVESIPIRLLVRPMRHVKRVAVAIPIRKGHASSDSEFFHMF